MNERKLQSMVLEPEGHALGTAQAPGPSVVIACACGWEDTWKPQERATAVARRFNRHLPDRFYVKPVGGGRVVPAKNQGLGKIRERTNS